MENSHPSQSKASAAAGMCIIASFVITIFGLIAFLVTLFGPDGASAAGACLVGPALVQGLLANAIFRK